MIEFKVGTKEHLVATVTADVLLDGQTVEFSIDHGATWIAGEWQGQVGLERRARTADGVTFPSPTRGQVLVRVDDASEVPILEAGDFKVTPL